MSLHAEFEYESHTTTRGYSYSFIHIPPPADQEPSSKPYILFLHGFPSLPRDFHHQIRHFSSLGYGVLAPTMLGYPGSSRPSDPATYRLKLIANDLVDLLDDLNIKDPVVGIGHDWGVPILTRLEFYHPQRIQAIVFLTIGYSALGQPFDLDTVNDMTEQATGKAFFGYQEFFVRQHSAALAALDSDAGRHSFHSLMFTGDIQRDWAEHFGARRGLETWLREARTAHSVAQGITEQDMRVHEEAFGAGPSTTSHELDPGYAGPLQYYVTLVENLNLADEVQELERQATAQYQTRSPVLLILAADDPITPAEMHIGMTRPYAGEFTVEVLPSCGHWVMMEKADEVNDLVQEFLQDQEKTRT